MEILKLIVAILTGIATAVPLIIKLVQAIQEAARSKNWTVLMQLVLQLITDAENNFSTGEERKQYVISTVKTMEKTLNCDIDEDALGEMIDAIVKTTRQVNINKK